MRTLELPLPPDINADLTEHIIQEVIAERGLNITLRDTLKAYSGSVHWHLKRGREPGILELTSWPKERRAWFSVQSRRDAPWVEEEMEYLYEILQHRFAST